MTLDPLASTLTTYRAALEGRRIRHVTADFDRASLTFSYITLVLDNGTTLRFPTSYLRATSKPPTQ